MQPPADVGVGQPLGHQIEDLGLAGGQRRHAPPSLLPSPRRQRGDHPEHDAGHRRGEVGVSGLRRADRADQLVGGAVLEHEPGDAVAQRAQHVRLLAEGRQHHGPDAGGVPPQLVHRAQPVEHGHADVQQRHVDAVRERLLDGRSAVPRLGDDLDVRRGLQHRPDAGGDERLVVGDEDPDHVIILLERPRGR